MTVEDPPEVTARPEVGLGGGAVPETLVPTATSTAGTGSDEASEEAPEKRWQDAEPPEDPAGEPAGEVREHATPASPGKGGVGGVNTVLDFSAEVLDDPIQICLREIARVQLLSARDEVQLATPIERGAESKRQVEVKALRRLRHPSRSWRLRDYIE